MPRPGTAAERATAVSLGKSFCSDPDCCALVIKGNCRKYRSVSKKKGVRIAGVYLDGNDPD
jgi:hypothetical protein